MTTSHLSAGVLLFTHPRTPARARLGVHQRVISGIESKSLALEDAAEAGNLANPACTFYGSGWTAMTLLRREESTQPTGFKEHARVRLRFTVPIRVWRLKAVRAHRKSQQVWNWSVPRTEFVGDSAPLRLRLLRPSVGVRTRAFCYAPTVLERVLGLHPTSHWSQPRNCVRPLRCDWRSAPPVTPRALCGSSGWLAASSFSRRWVGAAVLASHVRPKFLFCI